MLSKTHPRPDKNETRLGWAGESPKRTDLRRIDHDDASALSNAICESIGDT